MVFYTTLNNISIISLRSVLLVEETRVPRENLSQVTDKLYHIMLYRVQLVITEFELAIVMVIGSDCTCSFKILLPYDHDHDDPS
jgi:hypothetical protein